METPDPTPRKGLALGSAAIGAAAILGSLLAFSGGAGAQDAPELTEPAPAAAIVADAGDVELGDEVLELDPELEAAFAAFDECFSNELGIDLETADDAAWDALDEDTFIAAEDACDDLLPEDLLIDADFGDLEDAFALDGDFDADFAAYDDCVQGELGIDFETADDAAWEAIGEDAWVAADEACEDQLPQEILDMNEAFEKYDDCLAANGIDFEDEALAVEDLGAHVFIEDGENFSMAEFGDADGTITITQTDGNIEIASSGDVEVADFADVELDEEWEAAHSACEGELPEDAFFGDFDGDMDMELLEAPADA